MLKMLSPIITALHPLSATTANGSTANFNADRLLNERSLRCRFVEMKRFMVLDSL